MQYHEQLKGMTMTKRRTALVAGGVLVASGLAVTAAYVAGASPTLQEAPVASFGVLARPQTSEEAGTVRTFSAVSPGNISNGRVLGIDPDGSSILLTSNGSDVCLAITEANDPVAHGKAVKMTCDPAATLTDGLWMEYGSDAASYLVTAVPSQYSGSAVQTTGRKLIANDNVVLVRTRGLHTDSVTLKSSKYKPLTAGVSR